MSKTISPAFIILCQELRKRILLWLSSLIVISLALLPFANRLFDFFARPLIHTLSSTQPLIAIGIISGFWIPIELSLWLALLLSTPFLLWQLWLFVAPALKAKEKSLWRCYLGSSMLLFFSGLLFCYFIILPLCLHLLTKAAPTLVKVMPDIANYLNFSFRLLLTFGLICQVPLVITLLCQLNLTTVAHLKKSRRYVIIAAFVIGMIIAPDVISQCFLAIPLWALFELGLLLSMYLSRKLK